MIFINEFAPLSPDFKFIESAGGDFTECWILTQDLDHYHKEKKKTIMEDVIFIQAVFLYSTFRPPNVKIQNGLRLLKIICNLQRNANNLRTERSAPTIRPACFPSLCIFN